ncbi:complex I subunit 5 family protein [Ectothiorhodospira lacustris]|uniref:complex I subunit 5 family protein n=1 Tax=Ectothiorhodospira lacustris TaxID=2899127 RepID=UPI001EE88CB7|nr:complex I subunit 5 family protein [Ectothiorhodospira lacustris]MCG5500216.1 complex I subunit 5 family protein [Ectothiorhodospira lacustris]MCG5509560.1 complex I subunit 5 family protein [Ectothiorhodospira lacustris]MCG5521645.1 complex I subunit 5 family protein [Ectothiorhodospira lacustris]
MTPQLWLILIPATPLLLVLAMALPGLGRHLWRLTPLAVLPALAGLVWLPDGAWAFYPWLLVGTELALDPVGRGFLLLTALLWGAAAVYAQGYLGAGPARVRFHAFFLLAMAGNLGLVVAADVVFFYTSFALMSLAAMGLVVHDQRFESWRAGWVYLGMAVAGEVALFTGLILLVHDAGGHGMVRVWEQPPDAMAVALLVIGLGVKAGLVPLHVWLPLAHPAAPTPASAVLSGAMIKAGLLGWMRLLPPGSAPEALGTILVVLGLVGAGYGVAAGVFQYRAKTVLAYSSISQMGLMTAGLGVAIAHPALAPALISALVIYALHHGIAKAALFLGVGIAQRVGRPAALAWLLLPGLALAGMPLTSGAVAKILLKAPLYDAPVDLSLVTLLLSTAAAGTLLLMLRFWVLAAGGAREPRPVSVFLWLPCLVLVLGTVLLPWALAPEGAFKALTPDHVLAVAWPMGLGLLIGGSGVLLARLWGGTMPRLIPEGDLWVPLEWGGQAVLQWIRRTSVFWRMPGGRLSRCLVDGLPRLWAAWLDRVAHGERLLLRWETLGLMFVGLVLAVLAVLYLGAVMVSS